MEILVGTTSAAVTTGISNVIAGRDFFDYNVLGAALLSAAQGAATVGLQKVVRVSQASAQAEGGAGADKNLSISGKGGTQTVQVMDEDGKLVTLKIKYGPVTRSADLPLGRVGVDVEISVEGMDGGDWVQNVRDNNGSRRIDPAPMTHDRPGLYYSSNNREEFGSTFIDGPRRTTPTTWRAELSLVSLGADGHYHIVTTFAYGFTSSGTWSLDPALSTLSVRPAPFVNAQPSTFQVNTVRAIGFVP